MSTSLALTELTEEITSALDDKKSLLVCLLTIKRLLTQLNIINTINIYGVRCVANKWLRVTWGALGFYSRTQTVCTVCTWYMVYVILAKYFVLFADDNNIFCSGHYGIQLFGIQLSEYIMEYN